MDDFCVGAAGLVTSIHAIRILAREGLASAADIEEVYSGIQEAMELASPKMQAIVAARIDPEIATLKALATENYRPRATPQSPSS